MTQVDINDIFDVLSGAYGEILETHAMWECITALGVKPYNNGNQWYFLYGGVCGFGETVFEAAWDFYTNIKIQKAV